ncbi:MAG: VWA domain-containing protein [Acidobacteriaceae bacterium]|nr:VWA domain-containing protein [Acidobacteriaceae bacterium]
MTRAFLLCCLINFAAIVAQCETGVIIPTGHDGPDPSILSIESMDVNAVIDNGHATVFIKEVFCSRSEYVLEGTYSLALPDDAAVSDFAVWDGLTRIPGVILERKRAAELYQQIRNQNIDPGLLESSEVTESNAPGRAQHSTAFGVKIVPIPAFGYKRIEAAYRQNVRLVQLNSDFVFPLKASTAAPVRVGRLSIRVEVRSALPIAKFEDVGGRFGLKLEKQTPQLVVASTTQQDVPLSNDLEIKYSLSNDPSPRVTAFHDADPAEPGYFETAALLQPPRTATGETAPPRSVIVLFDTSLSMQWDKLERSFQALEGVLRSLSPKETFNVIVFNSEAVSFGKEPRPATTEEIARSLDFVRGSRLRGGTNLESAFRSAFAQCGPNSYVVLLSDGEATQGVIAPARIVTNIDRDWRVLPPERRPHLYTLAVGDDANARLMRRLAEHGGVFEQVNSTEPLDFKLSNFIHEIGLAPRSPVALTVSAQAETKDVYRLGQDSFPGSRASWVGEYTKPGVAQFSVASGAGATARKESVSFQLPAKDTQHEYLPATWARARVDALLEKIDREGEDKATIDEIIRLSRKYHFVTPYTSFLAAPRALLRPRLIRPGDPILRVRTDASIASVIAMFPFGLTKPLRYVAREDIWQTRFLAPDDLTDGAYTVQLILRDRDGHVYREHKTFLISSHAPIVRVTADSTRVHAGNSVLLHVQASATTRIITAQLYGAPPLSLRWSESEKANTGWLSIPANLPAGRYSVHVTAEDIAHNVSHQEMPLEVLP